MTDAEYMFKQEVREKAITARSAHKIGSARRRKCSFSSDHMTKKEMEKLNGPSYTVQLDEPMTWADLKALPKGLQREYCATLVERYGVGPVALGRMFGVHEATCSKYLKTLGVKVAKAGSKKATARFLEEFLAKSPDRSPVVPVAPEAALERIALTISGAFSPAALADRLAAFGLTGQDVTVNVEIVIR